MTHLLLIRHGETDWNRENRFQGQNDIPLNAAGIEQGRALQRLLHDSPLDVVYTSDLSRARQTAETILGSRTRTLPILSERRLRERNYGRWEGLTREEVMERFPDSWNRWRTEFACHRPEGGETLTEVRQRVSDFLDEILRTCEGQKVMVVGHGGSVKTLVVAALGASVEALRSFQIDNASLTELQFHNGKCQVTVMNDTCHLLDP